MKLTVSQMKLLGDLAALEDAGMISKGGSLDVWEGVYGGSSCQYVKVEPVVTDLGRTALQESKP